MRLFCQQVFSRWWVACIVLLLVVSIPYLGVGKLGFSWIEPGEILNRTLIIDSWGELLSMFSTNDQNFSGYHRPVYNLALSLDWHLWKEWAPGHHWSTLLNHGLNVILLYLFVGLYLKQWRFAFAVALLWGLLPVHSSVVPMIVGKSDTLPFFFLMLTLVFSQKASGAERVWGWFAGAAAAYFLALFSKESALMLPSR